MKIFKLFLFCFLSYSIIFAQQRQTFDVATFTPPLGWQNEIKDFVTSYVTTNSFTGGWCRVTIYKSIDSKGSLKSDFESEWQNLIVKNHLAKADPELVPAVSENGWEAQGGTAPYDYNGTQSIAMLVTTTGYGRCLSMVILTNTDEFQGAIESFLESVDLKKIDTTSLIKTNSSTSSKSNNELIVKPKLNSKFTFTTSNFDNGWTSTEQEDWVQVSKGSIKVLVHYPNRDADIYNSVLMDGLKNAWNILVAPRYNNANNIEFKPVSGWQSIEFAEADMMENTSNQQVHVVLFKINYSGGDGKYMEFITPDKKTFEQEFGAYHQESYGWERMEAMVGYNKFAVAAAGLLGKWTNSFSGLTQYVNANTGASAGADTHSSAQNFEFKAGNLYNWDLAVANGFVGNIKFQNVKSKGTFSMPNNWQIKFSDLEGKPKTYNVYFSCIKGGARILWLQDTQYGGYSAYGKVD